jgi:hypothetical protein
MMFIFVAPRHRPTTAYPYATTGCYGCALCWRGPDVVWLTTDPECRYGHGLLRSLDGTDKTQVRIAVALPNRDVHKWCEWAIWRGVNPEWMRSLLSAAGGGAGRWRVTEKPVPASRWVDVIDRHKGTVLWQSATID